MNYAVHTTHKISSDFHIQDSKEMHFALSYMIDMPSFKTANFFGEEIIAISKEDIQEALKSNLPDKVLTIFRDILYMSDKEIDTIYLSRIK